MIGERPAFIAPPPAALAEIERVHRAAWATMQEAYSAFERLRAWSAADGAHEAARADYEAARR